MYVLYKNIKKLREEKGMSQAELAKMMGYTHRSSITKIEKGEVDLPLSKVKQFARVFGVKPGDLVGWEENLTEENAELIPDILSDGVLLEHIKKLINLSTEHQRTIYDNIAYWYEKEGH